MTNQMKDIILKGFLKKIEEISINDLNLSPEEGQFISSILNDQTWPKKMAMIENFPSLITMMDLSPRQEMSLIKSAPYLISLVKNQNSAMALIAFNKNPYSYERLNFLPTHMKKEDNPNVYKKNLVELFNQESEEVQLLGIEFSPFLIQYVKNPTQDFLAKVSKTNKAALDYLDKEYMEYNGVKTYQHTA